MRVILIAIGIHTKSCIASLAFKARNWEYRYNTLQNTSSTYVNRQPHHTLLFLSCGVGKVLL